MKKADKKSSPPEKQEQPAPSGPIETRQQISAGGVAYRHGPAGLEVALVRVPPHNRWQLPKGIVDPAESPEQTAVREVREEAGIETRLLSPIETIEYWYVGRSRGQRIRYHKFVHFYLLTYLSGSVDDHDHEVEEARWFPIDQAAQHLTFSSEKKVLTKALTLIPP